MFKALASLLVATLGHAALAGTYQVDPAHSAVNFSVRHMFTKVTGNFQKYEGALEYDPAKKALKKITFTIQADSINTNDAKRDEHLRNADFFDAGKFKTITFTSSSIKSAGDNEFKVTGDLNMHGKKKAVTYDVKILGVAKDPWGNNKLGAQATTKINRKDFGIVYNKEWVPEQLLIGDEVDVDVQLQAAEAKAKG